MNLVQMVNNSFNEYFKPYVLSGVAMTCGLGQKKMEDCLVLHQNHASPNVIQKSQSTRKIAGAILKYI